MTIPSRRSGSRNKEAHEEEDKTLTKRLRMRKYEGKGKRVRRAKTWEEIRKIHGEVERGERKVKLCLR